MISCSNYDYIEIACLYHYPIKLTMTSGETIECTALDTQRNESREECIKVVVNGKERLVELDNIAKLQVCVENPHFNAVSFSKAGSLTNPVEKKISSC